MVDTRPMKPDATFYFYFYNLDATFYFYFYNLDGGY
jgi:hypothetical protein